MRRHGTGEGPQPKRRTLRGGRPMETEHLREFVELARVCNFTKAAGRLGISRTALS